MQPVRSLSKDDNWKIDFKSARITREVVESMRLVEDKHLRETYNVLHKTPESSSLAGSIFVAIVHRTFSNGQRSDRLTLQATRMVCDNCDPPAFSTDLSSPPSVPDTSSSLPPLRARTKAVTLVNLAHNLSNLTLGNDRYYVQTTTNNPLFDSFAIDRDLDRRTTVISVFQITTSSTHGGSARGYLRIRRIVARVRNLLESEGLNATVKVAYILVCPDDGSRHQWQMPVGWHDDLTHNDHRGDAFCVCVPVSVHRNILRQSTPEKEAEAEVNKRTTKKGKVRYCYFKSTTVGGFSHKCDRNAQPLRTKRRKRLQRLYDQVHG